MPLAPKQHGSPAMQLQRRTPRGPRGGFSLIELVVVVTIIAIISAIAVRRLSHHVEQAGINAAAQDVSTLQNAIERYRAEHAGAYPSATDIADQLTKYTDSSGLVSASRTVPYVYGPYVRKIPPVPAGPASGRTKIAATAASDVGWLYDISTGTISVNGT